MTYLPFLTPAFRRRNHQGVEQVFDDYRKRWVILTPEEWVRQQVLQSFTRVLSYPAQLIGVERQLKVGERIRRFDAVVFNPAGKPWLLLECKAETEKLKPKAASQLLAYQSALGATYLVLCNGIECIAWKLHQGEVWDLAELPVWPF